MDTDRLSRLSVLINAKQFLENYIPVPDAIVSKIYKSLEEQGAYKDSRWVTFPEKSGSKVETNVPSTPLPPYKNTTPVSTMNPASTPFGSASSMGSISSRSTAAIPGKVKEVSLCGPFVDVANKITECAQKLCPQSTQGRLHGEWVNVHNRATVSSNYHPKMLLPDISFMSVTSVQEMKMLAGALEDENNHSDNATDQGQVSVRKRLNS